MTKNKPSHGFCIHCQRYFEDLTCDHVLPKSWYPNIPTNFEKYSVPCCRECNHRLGKIEEGLLTKLGICLDPTDTKSFGISERVLRSVNPKSGKNDQDKANRIKKWEKLIRNVDMVHELPRIGIFPNFGPLPEINYPEYAVVAINEIEIQQLAEKIIRGAVYISDKTLIDSSYVFKIYAAEDKNVPEIYQMLSSFGKDILQHPAFKVRRALVENQNITGIYFIEIWSKFKLFVMVMPKDLKKDMINKGLLPPDA